MVCLHSSVSSLYYISLNLVMFTNKKNKIKRLKKKEAFLSFNFEKMKMFNWNVIYVTVCALHLWAHLFYLYIWVCLKYVLSCVPTHGQHLVVVSGLSTEMGHLFWNDGYICCVLKRTELHQLLLYLNSIVLHQYTTFWLQKNFIRGLTGTLLKHFQTSPGILGIITSNQATVTWYLCLLYTLWHHLVVKFKHINPAKRTTKKTFWILIKKKKKKSIKSNNDNVKLSFKETPQFQLFIISLWL